MALHTRAKRLFEQENPGRLWRVPAGTKSDSPVARKSADLMERQNYLARVRASMRAEGAILETEEDSPQLSLGG